jgi:predicted transposase YdaD
MEIGMEIGLKQGREEGREEGMAQGIEKGKEEIALSCLEESLPLEFIERLTGLTKEKISMLRSIKKDER